MRVDSSRGWEEREWAFYSGEYIQVCYFASRLRGLPAFNRGRAVSLRWLYCLLGGEIEGQDQKGGRDPCDRKHHPQTTSYVPLKCD